MARKGLAVVMGLGGLLMAGLGAQGVRAGEDASRPEFYSTKVKPILDQRCGSCHEGMNHRGGLNMATRASLMQGGHTGPVVVPGDPEKSLLVRLMRHEGPANDPMPMPPPPRPKASDAEIATVAEWVKAGAAMPEDVPKP